MSPHRLSSFKVAKLTRVLQLLPREDAVSYTTRINSLTQELPPSLKRPSRLSTLFRKFRNHYDVSPLCPLHSGLDGKIIHGLFTLVSLEVGIRLNEVVAHSECLTIAQHALVEELRALHSLWLPPNVYKQTFLQDPLDGRWPYQHDRCEACMLARIGGDWPILLRLRAAVLSRTRSRTAYRDGNGPPRLIVFLESWVRQLDLGPKMIVQILEKSQKEAQTLKLLRKDIRTIRREAERGSRNAQQGKHGYSPVLQSRVNNVTDVPDISTAAAIANTEADPDIENHLINHYAVLISTPHLPGLLTSSESTAVDRHESPPVLPPKQLAIHPRAAESRYTLNTQAADIRSSWVAAPAVASFEGSQRIAGHQAQSYANLLDLDEPGPPSTIRPTDAGFWTQADEEPNREKGKGKTRRPSLASACTRWSDLYKQTHQKPKPRSRTKSSSLAPPPNSRPPVAQSSISWPLERERQRQSNRYADTGSDESTQVHTGRTPPEPDEEPVWEDISYAALDHACRFLARMSSMLEESAMMLGGVIAEG